MTCKEAAAIGQSMGFPGYSPAAHSLASHPEKNGVTWVPKLAQIFGPVERHRDMHKKQYSFRVRVTKERYEAVKRLLEAEGKFPTINAWLDWWVWVWLNQKESAAPGGGTPETAND